MQARDLRPLELADTQGRMDPAGERCPFGALGDGGREDAPAASGEDTEWGGPATAQNAREAFPAFRIAGRVLGEDTPWRGGQWNVTDLSAGHRLRCHRRKSGNHPPPELSWART